MAKYTDKKGKYIVFDIKKNKLALFKNQEGEPLIFDYWLEAYDNLTETDRVFTVQDIEYLICKEKSKSKQKEYRELIKLINK